MIGTIDSPKIFSYLQASKVHPSRCTHLILALFSNANEEANQGGLGFEILKNIKKAIQLKSYQRMGYIGNGVILTQIVYEALGMCTKIQLMPKDEEVL